MAEFSPPTSKTKQLTLHGLPDLMTTNSAIEIFIFYNKTYLELLFAF
jgi:hypothetical protein